LNDDYIPPTYPALSKGQRTSFTLKGTTWSALLFTTAMGENHKVNSAKQCFTRNHH